MSFQRPTLENLITRTRQDFESRLEIAGTLLRRAVSAVLAKVVAGAAHLLHGYLEFISQQLMPDTAIDSYMLRWASIWGIVPTPGSYASGIADVEGLSGTVIPAGTLWRRSDGRLYETLAEVTIEDESAVIALESLEAGVDANCDAGTQLSIVTPILGVNSSALVDSEGLGGGADGESNDSIRARTLDRIRRPPMGGAITDYEKWAREVPGVTRVWVYPEWLGPGTVGVTFVRDGDGEGAEIIPDSGEVETVQDYIDARRPVTAHVTVFAPIADPVDYEIIIVPNTEVVKAAVEAELADMHFRDATPGGSILISRMHEAIAIAEGETDHTLISPAANHNSSAGNLPILGTISWVSP